MRNIESPAVALAAQLEREQRRQQKRAAKVESARAKLARRLDRLAAVEARITAIQAQLAEAPPLASED